ncbi:MAG: hypothetical protein ABIR18_11805, partial [Chitinophagaceae bacterium]
MLRWILCVCLIALLLALNTSPTQKEFKAYIYNRVDTTHGKPLIQYNSYKLVYFDLFSLNYVREDTEAYTKHTPKNLTSQYGKEQKY